MVFPHQWSSRAPFFGYCKPKRTKRAKPVLVYPGWIYAGYKDLQKKIKIVPTATPESSAADRM